MARRRKYVERLLKQRASLWPEFDDDDLWLRNDRDGFTTIPRNLGLICGILDDLSKGVPLASTYLELWCRVYDEGFVIVSKPREIAFFSGFTGQRAERTWANRMKKLETLGFIMIKSGPAGSISYVLMINPYHAIFDLKQQKDPGLREDKYNALITRSIEIGAADLDQYQERREASKQREREGKAKTRSSGYDDLDDEIPF
jgi:hypothetical protein